jgi:MFS family permease
MSPQTKPKVVAMIVASAIIMQQIDSTVITTALPQMAISLRTDPVRLSVAVTAYMLSLAVFVPLSPEGGGASKARPANAQSATHADR